MTLSSLVTPVILSGGGGTRLWPLSRPEKPKQLLPLASARTMLQETALRVQDRTRYAAPLIIGSQAHAEEIEAQLAAVDCAAAGVILEPVGRNTAPAIALAALEVHPDTLLLIMPSDHVIAKPEALHRAVAAGLPFAQDGWLVTFGITPTAPETGYGYIRLGATLSGEVRRVERFIEKPARPVAEAMIAAGGHAWNGGIFLFRAGAYLDALTEHAPEILRCVKEALSRAERNDGFVSPDSGPFTGSPSESIDYAVMEKAERVAVVPVELGWSDVGSWDALYELGPHDSVGNLATGDVRLVDTTDCLIRSEGVRVSALGVSGLVVVATNDEVLIIPRGRSQEVRRLFP